MSSRVIGDPKGEEKMGLRKINNVASNLFPKSKDMNFPMKMSH